MLKITQNHLAIYPNHYRPLENERAPLDISLRSVAVLEGTKDYEM